jgi:hypothetical protein
VDGGVRRAGKKSRFQGFRGFKVSRLRASAERAGFEVSKFQSFKVKGKCRSGNWLAIKGWPSRL